MKRTGKLSDLASAYAILSDPVRRRRYDLRRRIDALIAPHPPTTPRQKGPPPVPSLTTPR
jgi:curved DNA-binding protein CbpA